ncbi:hypothetical protein HRbin29_01079 [bacterium HR29]|jgi:hypothetical protein|nr:hypothetical protein HRbin29_01079 [bacterium HR29]
MTLRFELVAEQLPGVIARYRESVRGAEAAAEAALRALRSWAADPEAGNQRIAAAMEGTAQPYALSAGESPSAAFDPPPSEPWTVVAADGSSISPDRFAPVPCWVVNVGMVALPYGLPGEPLLESRPTVGPTGAGGEEAGDDEPDDAAPSRGGINLLRDVMELEAVAELASSRVGHGAVIALLDGTLFPWDLDAPQIPQAVRDQLRDRTARALDRLRAAGPRVSLGAYISASRASDVVNSLRAFGAPEAEPLGADAVLFARVLGVGQRSAIFRARSERTRRVEQQFPAHEVCFFYLRIDDDLARVELPAWAAEPARVARLHRALLDQARHCGGYPRALQEAHELAVISSRDREQFARLLEAESARAGFTTALAGKQRSKRRRVV